MQKNRNSVVESVSYQYTRADYIKDAIGIACLGVGFGIMVWFAFALDVITTGM